MNPTSVSIARVVDRAHAGNVYVNRNMVGAVVAAAVWRRGPMGRCTDRCCWLLSQRPADHDGAHLCRRRPRHAARVDGPQPPVARLVGPAAMGTKPGQPRAPIAPASALHGNAKRRISRTLPGPTGERNVYTLAPAPMCCA